MSFIYYKNTTQEILNKIVHSKDNVEQMIIGTDLKHTSRQYTVIQYT